MSHQRLDDAPRTESPVPADGAPRGPIGALLEAIRQDVGQIEDGTVADYIPELAKADPATFAISLATLDGAVYTVGDLVPFTIQSVSKPFVYALALADRGRDAVLAKVGTEPTGDPFNTISIDHRQRRAFNPMVNAGAIATAALVGGDSRAAQFDRILTGLSAFAGRQLAVDEAVFASEHSTGDRNRAIAYLLRSAGILEPDVEDQVTMYFRQCAVLVTAQDLAVMAATLANAGVNPTTGEQVVPREVVAPVLTVMSSCGMYDYAGEWLYRVGLPAKSGVSGGIAAALPGQLGLAAHSPRLDERGNSVRGVAACEALSERLGLHLLLPNERARASARRTYRGDAVRSKRARRASERAVLDRAGRRIVVHELIGDQEFAAVENLVRAVLTDIEGGGWRVLHLRRVTRLDLAAVALLSGLIADLVAGGVQVAIVDPKGHAGRAAAFELGDVPHFGDLDQALEWCEDALLAEHGAAPALPDELVPLSDQDVLADLDPAVLQALESRITTKIFTPGTVVFDEGDASDGLYFIAAGLVAADVKVPGGRKRLSTSGPGSSFGELALIDGRPRSTRIVALEPTMCQVLSQEAFADLGRSDPAACAALTMALARSLSQRLRYSTAEVAALTSA